MIDLNNTVVIAKLDPKNVSGSTELFIKQCEQIIADAKKLKFPSSYTTIDHVILCGMGGSAYGGYVAQALYKDSLPVNIYSNNDYHLPAFVTKNTLIILSSYSGSTEEVLSCAEEAKQKGCLITGMTTGGKLAEFLNSEKLPALLINPLHNPSMQPRLGTGYMVLGFLLFLKQLGILSLSENEVETAVLETKTNQENIKQQAKITAEKLLNYMPSIFAAELLNGNPHILRNQLNETAKVLGMFEDIPELNHHLMEGLINPKDKKLAALFLESSFYSEIIKKRIVLTKDVIEKNNAFVLSFNALGSTKLSHVLSTLSFGGYLSLYLALLYGQDPSLIPWVDYFKKELTK